MFSFPKSAISFLWMFFKRKMHIYVNMGHKVLVMRSSAALCVVQNNFFRPFLFYCREINILLYFKGFVDVMVVNPVGL